MAEIAPSEAPPGPDQATTEGRLATQLENIITARLASGRLTLPSMPAAALRCLQLLRNPDLALKAAADVIGDDPVLAAQLIHLSNSAAYVGRDRVQTVLGAVTKLGASKVRVFLYEASANQLFESRDARIVQACRVVWEHSLAVALLAKNVVTFTNAGDADAAYLGGLLHDIGKPVVASLLLEVERTLVEKRMRGGWIGSDEWARVIARVHRRVGVALAERWELPEAVGRCIRECGDYDASARLSVVNAVRFANALAKREGVYLGEVDADDNDALIMIGTSLLGLEPAIVDRLVASLKDELAGRAA